MTCVKLEKQNPILEETDRCIKVVAGVIGVLTDERHIEFFSFGFVDFLPV